MNQIDDSTRYLNEIRYIRQALSHVDTISVHPRTFGKKRKNRLMISVYRNIWDLPRPSVAEVNELARIATYKLYDNLFEMDRDAIRAITQVAKYFKDIKFHVVFRGGGPGYQQYKKLQEYLASQR